MPAFIVPIQPMESIKTSDFSKSTSTQLTTDLPFHDILTQALDGLESATTASTQDGYNLALGDVDDLAQLQINSLKAQNMLQTTVQLTTRAVNAYKEIMQMQI